MSLPGNFVQGLHVRQLPPAPQDPATNRCPDWDTPWMQPFIQSLMMAEVDNNGNETRPARPVAEAVTDATAAWSTAHDVKVRAWNSWLTLQSVAQAKDADEQARFAREAAALETEQAELDARAADERRRREQEEIMEAARLSMLKKHADQQAALVEIPDDIGLSSEESVVPSTWAFNQIAARKNTPLVLFSPDRIRAQDIARVASGYDDADISIGQIRDGQFELVAAGAPKNLTPNKLLQWSEVTAAIPVLAETMRRCGKYTASACVAIATLPVELNQNPSYRGKEQDQTNVAYVAHTLDRFFTMLRTHVPGDLSTPQPFNPGKITHSIWLDFAKERRDAEQAAAT